MRLRQSVMLSTLATLATVYPVSAQALPSSNPIGDDPLLTFIANSLITSNGWEVGYWNNLGQYQRGTPTWGALTSEGGQFTDAATTQNHLVRRWISPFTGQVSLTTFFGVDAQLPVNAEIRVNGDRFPIYPQEQVGSALNMPLNIRAGDAIDFVFTPGSNNQAGMFDFSANIDVPAGLVFINPVVQVTNPYTRPPIGPREIVVTPVPFDLQVKQIAPDPANVRSGPDRSFPVQRTYLSGDSISFDAWTIGEFVNETYGTGDRWYRIVGTDWWMSETVINGSPPALPPVPAVVTVNATQVSFVAANKAYESFQGYASGMYFDLFGNPSLSIPVQSVAGVQNQQSLGSFITQSASPTDRTLPHWHLDVRNTVPMNRSDMRETIASTMLGQIQSKLGAGYLSPGCIGLLCPSSEEHKGSMSVYSAVGLIEAAAEQSSMNGGQGFIPTPLEDTQINSISFGSLMGTVSTMSVPPASPLSMSPVFTPDGFEFFMQNRAKYDGKWLNGWLEAVEFILTDPDGFQLGFRNGQQFNNIPSADLRQTKFVQNSDLNLPTLAEAIQAGMVPSDSTTLPQLAPVNPSQPVENLFQFVVGDRKPGQYLLQLWGLSENSVGLIVDDENGGSIIYPDPGGTAISVAAVPEPSDVGGLMLFGIMSGWFWRRRRKV